MRLHTGVAALSSTSEETLLKYIPLVWYASFEDLKPADLNERISASRIINAAFDKPALDTLSNGVACVDCSVGIFEVPVEFSDRLMMPRCTGLAEVQVGYGLGFVALQAEISRGAASSFAGADG
jgi:hypothetical protein